MDDTTTTPTERDYALARKMISTAGRYAYLLYDFYTEDRVRWKMLCKDVAALIAADRAEERERLVDTTINSAKSAIELLAENAKLRGALESAAQSLETIRDGAGKDMLETMMQIRGYANSRSMQARAALKGGE